jgi:DNA-binding CsgD family transcriptional regulator
MGTMISDPLTTMTPRQLELLALYASGNGLQQIADMKFLSHIAVRKTLATARERVGAENLAHLVGLCVARGILVRHGDGFLPVQDERVA